MSSLGAPIPPPGAPPAAPPSRPTDVVVTIVLLVLLGLGAVVASFFGLFVGMVSDGCGDKLCTDRVGTGVLITAGAPLLCWLGALVGSVVRMVRRRSSWWVPLVAVLAWVVLLLIGVAVAGSAMP